MPPVLLDNPANFDVFDQLQLENVIRIFQQSKNAVEAGESFSTSVALTKHRKSSKTPKD